jgi:3-deoxy-manno-octulosonate cytidylyltransferase (CMP-KDO synthetase)
VKSVSLLSPIESEADYTNPNIVKAVCDQQGYIFYYSRAAIPYFQHPAACPIFRETGIRAFRKDFLQVYVGLPETPFERVESVDMLRLLEHGHKVFGVPTEYETIGVDHPEDVSKVEEILRADPTQKAFYDQIMMESV